MIREWAPEAVAWLIAPHGLAACGTTVGERDELERRVVLRHRSHGRRADLIEIVLNFAAQPRRYPVAQRPRVRIARAWARREARALGLPLPHL